MSYNIHPIFVHFPIALLFIYSILKVLPWDKWFPRFSWRHIEFWFLVLGLAGAFAALATGETAEHLIRANRKLVEAHSTFAVTATWLYGILLAGEVLSYIRNKADLMSKIPGLLPSLVIWAEKIVSNSVVMKTLSVAALVALTLTGLLGGAIVYGTTADPLTASVLQLLGIAL